MGRSPVLYTGYVWCRSRTRVRGRNSVATTPGRSAAGGTVGYQDILYSSADGVARITINRPEKYNAFRGETLDELIAAFKEAEADRTVGVIVLTGAGDKAFSAGGDISWEEASDAHGAHLLARQSTTLAMIMRGCGKPV